MRGEVMRGQLGDTDLRLLRIFRKVVECGGFSAAEIELNIDMTLNCNTPTAAFPWHGGTIPFR